MLNIYSYTYIIIMIILYYWNNVMHTCVLELRLVTAAYRKSIPCFNNNIVFLLHGPYSSFEYGPFAVFVGCCGINASGNVVRVYPEIIQGLTFYRSKV